ncbi:ATP-binding protein [Ferruginibacter sp. SUN106]|uniref:sensor histidine kinase n=1 Tax=Ferruginibacter sp. SUN106 TaxID=2978348 RepID=UPI003D35B19A
MKSFIKIAWLLLLPAFAKAQSNQTKLDSLHHALLHAANDTIRMDVCANISDFYSESNRDSSIFYMDQSLAIAKKLKLKLNEAIYLDGNAYELMHLGNYSKSLQASLQAIKIAGDPENEKYIWHQTFGNTPQIARLDILANIYHDLGHLYGATGNIDRQIISYLKADSIAAAVKDTVLQALANMNLGSVYLKNNKLDSGLAFEQKSLALYATLPSNTRRYEGWALNNLAVIQLKKGNLELSRNTFEKAIAVNIKQNNLAALGISYSLLSNLFKTSNRLDSGILYAKKARDILKGLNNLSGLADVYSMLSSLFEEKDNKDSALHYLNLAGTLKDSLNYEDKKNLQAYQTVGFDEQLRLEELEKEKIETQTKIRTYVLLAGIGVFMLIALLFYRNNRSRKRSNTILQNQKEELQAALSELKSTQSQLIQSEKMASLGELTAGIAHEIQNPLNFVNNFSEINKELLAEMNAEIEKGNYNEVKEIAKDVTDNEEKINHHGKRADAIVKGMLQHSRSSSGVKEPTDINALADEYLRLAYHGLRAKDKSFNATLKTDFDASIGNINIIPQDIGRVILNLITNAFYVVDEKKKASVEKPGSENLTSLYEPTVSVSTKKVGDKVLISVADNGNGIPPKVLDKIFQPFFTTKPTGQGTGLGLSLSYDIVKAHGGELKVETKEDVGSAFIINLYV